jgi:TPR repeat protein
MRCLAVITMLVLAIAIVQPASAQSFKPDYDAGLTAYERGDHGTALKHWRPLAKQGDARAQLQLSIMNSHGIATFDYKEAVRRYRKAAMLVINERAQPEDDYEPKWLILKEN